MDFTGVCVSAGGLSVPLGRANVYAMAPGFSTRRRRPKSVAESDSEEDDVSEPEDVDMASEEEQSTKELEPEPEPEPEPKLAKAPPQESPTKVAQTFL